MRLLEVLRHDDRRIAAYRDLRDVQLRDAHDLFLVEGRLCVRRLVEGSRFQVRSLLLTRAALAALGDLLPKLDEDTPVHLASQELLKEVTGLNFHRGCLAAAERGEAVEAEALLRAPGPRLLLVLEDVANPDNVGGAFRNAWAFGADAVLLAGHCADPLYRKAVRVSMGGVLGVPFARVESCAALLERLAALGFRSVALANRPSAAALGELPRPPAGARTALVVGSEGEGLRAATLAAAQLCVRIPVAPGVDSLNLATAAGIALHHFGGRE